MAVHLSYRKAVSIIQWEMLHLAQWGGGKAQILSHIQWKVAHSIPHLWIHTHADLECFEYKVLI